MADTTATDQVNDTDFDLDVTFIEAEQMRRTAAGLVRRVAGVPTG